MKARPWILVLSILMVLAFAQTRKCMAYHFSGNEFVEYMGEYDKDVARASEVDYFKDGIFSGYAAGVCDAAESIYSIPHNATKGQILAVVSKYLKNHPEKWSEPAASLVIEALQEAFPLKNPHK